MKSTSTDQQHHQCTCHHLTNPYIMQRLNLLDNPKDILYKEPVSLPSRYSDTSIPSGDADHSAWDTNPVENPYHPVHFDSCGNCEDPITATYSATYLNYNDNDNDTHLYIGEKPSKPNNKFCMSTFDVCNYTDPKTNEYSYWSNTKLEAQPPVGLIACHLADSYCQEITII